MKQVTYYHTEAKLSFEPLGHKKKNENVEKTRSITINKASFETKTCRDNRTWNNHQKTIYPAVTKPIIPCQKPLRGKNDSRLTTREKLINPPTPQKIQYETSKPIKHSLKAIKPKKRKIVKSRKQSTKFNTYKQLLIPPRPQNTETRIRIFFARWKTQ